MKLDKLDFAVILIVAICLAGVAIAAYVSDPARQPARVAYLYPATAAQQNVWMAPINDPKAQQQATFSEFGVYDFDFSPDGRWLAFAERSGTGAVTLRLRDLATGQARDLVDCPAWPPIARRRSIVPMARPWPISAPSQSARATVSPGYGSSI